MKAFKAFLIFSLTLSQFLIAGDDEEKVAISTPEQILDHPYSLANFEGVPKTLIHNCVNALTGDYVDVAEDLVVEGSEPISLRRFYCSAIGKGGSLYGGWNHNLYGMAFRKKSDHHQSAVTKGGQGGEYLYKGGRGEAISIHPKMMSKGLTNCNKGKLSGRTNVKNHRLEFTDKTCELKSGDGKIHQYVRESSGRYLLKKVIKPNGFHHRYHYHDKKETLSSFYIQNSVGQTLGQLDMTPFQKKDGAVWTITATTPDGRQVVYTYLNFILFPPQLIKVEGSNTPPELYTYGFAGKKGHKITTKSRPDKRYLNIHYSKEGKVESLTAPAGRIGEEVPLFRFEYRSEKRDPLAQTLVYDPVNALTKYTYSQENFRLESIEKYQGEQPYSLEKYEWGKGAEEAQLTCHSLSERDRLCLCRRYSYDDRGNVTTDILTGDLCGGENNSFQKNCSYSNENLLLESNEHGYITKYTYHPGTDLLEAKYIITDGVIRKREFFLYDTDLAAIKLTIIDDGKGFGWDNEEGITERRITRITNNREPPYGLPKVIEEYAVSQGNEILLKQIVNHYETWGRLVKQDHYDNTRTLSYSLSWEYNDYGQVIKETDALGQVIQRRYDSNGNKVYEKGPHPNVYQEYTYDQMNRLIETKKYDNGKTYTTYNAYDPAGNKITETDIYGHETQRNYDCFGRVIIETLPPVLDENKTIYHPEKKYSYDLFGNVTSYTDPKGQTEQVLYTLYGKPYFKRYPDGSTESWKYTIRGELNLHVHQDGSYTTYKYDYDSRPTEILLFSKEGKLLKSIEKTYNAFHLTQEKISDGQVITYRYDFAGRLSEVLNNTKRTTYSYDSLGREQEKRVYTSATDYISYKKEYDLLNRVTLETEGDGQTLLKKIEYAYDVDGNQILFKTVDHTIHKEYDSFGRLMKSINGEGHVTTTSYQPYCNQYGVNVLYTKITDPLSNSKIIIEDALHRPELIKRVNKEGKTTQQTEYLYDRAGNRCRAIERVISLDPDNEILTAWQHDGLGRVIESAQAVAQPKDRILHYEYDPLGNLQKVIKPNGITVTTLYDALSRPIEKFSSGIHYQYEYNEKG